MELGEQLPPIPEHLQTEENRVKACMSQVWTSAFRDPKDHGLIHFHGDCDTAIIKGVLGLLIEVSSGHSAAEIAEMDFDRLFQQLELAENLSPNRHVGIYAIVDQLKQQASRLGHDITPDVAVS